MAANNNSKDFAVKGPAKYLSINFEGYFHCRIATDPDPTNEERGMSGYTMALPTEDKLDQVIRYQMNKAYLEKNCRPPAKEMGLYDELKKGVRVTSVDYDGEPQSNHVLIGAKVDLLGKESIWEGPIFESRNNIVGSDDTMSFVVDPFQLKIVKERRGKDPIVIYAEDVLDPAQPEKRIWELFDPNVYGRRLTSAFASGSEEVNQATGVFDYYGYFRDRRKYLKYNIDRISKMQHPTSEDLLQKQQFETRLYQLEFWGDRMITKMGFQCTWDFEINGKKEANLPKGKVDFTQNWPVTFWFGGWDGDMLTGYSRGTLNIPYNPKKNQSVVKDKRVISRKAKSGK